MKNRIGTQSSYRDFFKKQHHRGGNIAIYRGKRRRGGGVLGDIFKRIFSKKRVVGIVKKAAPMVAKKVVPVLVDKAPDVLGKMLKQDPKIVRKHMQSAGKLIGQTLSGGGGGRGFRKRKAGVRNIVQRKKMKHDIFS